jgi:hypothetical protein
VENPCGMTHLSRRDLIRYASAGAVAAGVGLRGGIASAAVGTTAPLASTSAAAVARLRMAHVRPRTPAQLALLARLDDTHTRFDDGTVEVLLRDGDLAELDAVGMDYDVIVPAAPADTGRTAGLLAQPGETADGEYRLGSARYEADLRALAAAHEATGRVRLLEMPTPSLLGTTVYALEIATDVANDDGRPVIIHDGMHHCREWPSGEMPMMWAHELLESYGTDPIITRIVDEARTFIFPLVNPDGFDRTVEFAAIAGQSGDVPLAILGLGDQHRKNLRAPSNVGPLEGTGPVVASTPVGASQPDAYGIDLNRNYPFHWGDESGSSSQPYDQTYRGLEPYSEPETHNVRDLVLAHLPVTHITHHTSGRQMLIPWGRDPDAIRSPDWPIMKRVGDEMRDGYTGPDGVEYAGNGYDPTQAFNLYPTSGTSRDWGHAATRTIIYTFEHGTQFHGPYPSTIPAMYELNRGAFIRHALAALDPDVHARITGAGPAGGTVEVTKTFQTPTNLQIVGVPVLSVGGLPAVADPTGDALRPTLVDESLSKTVRIGGDGVIDLRLPPSTRPFLVNEEILDGFEKGQTEAYTVIVRDPAGAEVYRTLVTVDRGHSAAIGPDVAEVTAIGVQDPNPLPEVE